jgi:hypothetical protein
MRTGLQADSRISPQGTYPAVLIRDMENDDVEAVWQLWAEYISEGFARSLQVRGHRRRGLSLDRWGPGIPIPANGAIATAEPSLEPSMAIRSYLRDLPAAAEAGALIAEAGQGRLAGFATYSLRRHPVLPGMVGHIDDVYARRDRSAGAVLMALLQAVTADLAGHGVRGLEYRLSKAPRSRLLRRALLDIGWERSGECVSYWQ